MSSNRNRSPIARPCLLLESGALQEGEAARPTVRSGVVLSRALCRFKQFRAAPGLSRSQAARAARTFAEAHAPYADSGWVALRNPQGAAIWYWDKAQLAALGAGEARSVSPESAWRRRGDGWRILACAEGFEAQYWEGGGLVASTWRREPFTREQWAAFVLGVETFEQAPPEAPPPPQALPMEDASWRAAVIKPPLGWRDAETAAVSVGLCAVALTAMFAAQALRREGGAREALSAASAVETRMRDDPRIARAHERAALLAGYSASFGGAEPLAAVADAFTVLDRFQLQVRSWSADRARFSVTIDAPIAETPVREIVAALEETPTLCGVTPDLAEAGFQLRAAVVASADAPCPDAGAEASP